MADPWLRMTASWRDLRESWRLYRTWRRFEALHKMLALIEDRELRHHVYRAQDRLSVITDESIERRKQGRRARMEERRRGA